MKNFIMLFVLLLPFVAYSEREDSKQMTETREARNFSRIEWTGTGNLFITQADKEEIKLKAPEDMLSNIMTEVRNETLYIEQKPGNWLKSFLTQTSFDTYVSLKNIESVSLAGKGTLKNEKTIKTKNLTLKVSGSGEVDLSIDVENLIASAMGSSNYHLKGKAVDQNVQISGSGTYDATQLLSQQTSIDIRGSGEANVNVQKQLDVIITGKGAVRYIGKPQISQRIFGNGIIEELKQ